MALKDLFKRKRKVVPTSSLGINTSNKPTSVTIGIPDGRQSTLLTPTSPTPPSQSTGGTRQPQSTLLTPTTSPYTTPLGVKSFEQREAEKSTKTIYQARDYYQNAIDTGRMSYEQASSSYERGTELYQQQRQEEIKQKYLRLQEKRAEQIEQNKSQVRKGFEKVKEKVGSTLSKASQFNQETTPKLIGVGIPFTPIFLSREQIKNQQIIEKGYQKVFEFGATKLTSISPFPKINKKIVTTSGRIGFFQGGVVQELIPYTAGGVAVVGLGGAISVSGRLVSRVIVSGTATGLGIAGALDTKLEPEQRVASGIVAGLGTTGLFFEAVPFVRGVRSRFSSDYRPTTKQDEGFIAVENINTKGYKGRIGIIPSGSPPINQPPTLIDTFTIPPSSPLRRGGFKSYRGEKEIYLGEQTIATSQRGLFKEGVEIITPKEFFVTPQEPTLKIPETRISRLGLTDMFGKPRQAEITFSYPTQPQIAIETRAIITRGGRGGTYKLGLKTSELEATKGIGTKITDVQRIGTTTINLQGVNIYSIRTVGSGRINTGKLSTTETTKIYGQNVLASFFTRVRTTRTYPSSQSILVISPSINIPSLSLSKTIKTKTVKTITKSSPSIRTPRTTSFILPSIRTPIITPPSIPTIKSPPIKIVTPPTIIKQIPPPPIFRFKVMKPITKTTRSFFGVQVRRFGKFQSIGSGLSLQQAINLGRERTTKTLGATFKITGGGNKRLRTPFGYYQKGELFIEKPKYRLSTTGEIKEIQMFKQMKGGIEI